MNLHVVKGGDEVLQRAAVAALVDDLLGDADRSLALENLEGADYEPGAVTTAAGTPPFLTDRRVVVAWGVERFDAEASAVLAAGLEDGLDTSIVVLVQSAGRLKKALADFVKGRAETHDVGVGNVKARGAYVTDRVKASAVSLDAPATRLVQETLGEDVGRLDAVLQALEAAHGPGAKLGPDGVRPYLGEAGSVPRWDLTDAIDQGDTVAALTALRRLTGAGGLAPMQVIATLHGHVARLLRLDGSSATTEQEAAEILGLKLNKGRSYPAQKALRQARSMGSEKIARAVALVADADLGLRGMTATPPDQTLEILVARLSRLSR